jgi:hypothetical protein
MHLVAVPEERMIVLNDIERHPVLLASPDAEK